MAAYFNTSQLKRSMQDLVREYIQECRECEELSQDCMDLIRHNFLAEFVVYNKEENAIEVGIEVSKEDDPYPQIKIYTIPLDEAERKIDHSFRKNHEDLEFYAKLLGKRKGLGADSVVVME
ncbi:hypothetical protein C7S20_09735 [Christiangramia fulva]|uniref:Uncharacterized protein n=1 Tax=Christiangramia fulva TaxID=2126553 RepID=A0A2R3Z5G5_9FLAO|nr:hypothetical protein [Christiangramia fulva]AVR45523.1 hypothetical protein C7S20_09735 [Christiangramia fulva]